MSTTKKARVRKLRIDAISAVDRAAQQPAYVRLLKRARAEEGEVAKALRAADVVLTKAVDPGDSVEKMAALTTSIDGHAHLVYLDDGQGPRTNGTTSHSKMNEEDEHGHSHPWVLSEGGELVIGEANGHTHTLATVSKAAEEEAEIEKRLMKPGKGESKKDFVTRFMADKGAMKEFPDEKQRAAVATKQYVSKSADETITGNQEGDAMPANEKKEGQSVEDRLAKAEARVERLTKERDLTETEAAHYATLTKDEDRTEFLSKTSEERGETIAKAAETAGDEQVIYKAADGTEFRKGDDPRLILMAKRLERQDVVIGKLTTEAELTSLHKRAETELGHLPGDVNHRAALLKAVEAIEDDEVRKQALAALKAGDTAASQLFKVLGHRDGRTEIGAEAGLDTLAKSYHEKHPDLTYEQSYAKVLDTDEGRSLSAELSDAR